MSVHFLRERPALPRQPGHRRESGAASRRRVLTLTVEQCDWGAARTAILRNGGAGVEILCSAPIPRSSRLRIQIGLECGGLDETMGRIMRALQAAEFGPVVPIESDHAAASHAHEDAA
ncbi:MAG TPA: hypothetical protein VEV20_08055 [Burkholderiales bacterium]|nr:hypothetical protein [Burkholderiales bacterium]